jgi:hypothetical protein
VSLLPLLGGTVGALLGQVLFRHKTKKWKFQRVFIMIVVVQVGGMKVPINENAPFRGQFHGSVSGDYGDRAVIIIIIIDC